MAELELWRYRAKFNATNRTYTVLLPHGEHTDRITYGFELWKPDELTDVETAPSGKWAAAITKTSDPQSEDFNSSFEVLTVFFAWLDSPDEFQPLVERILQEARERSVEYNLDEFWAVLKVVEDEMLTHDFGGDEDFYVENGIFQEGIADIYLFAPAALDDLDGLPDHVDEAARRCWRLKVARVLSEETHQPLGWAVVAVHFPDLAPNADDILSAQRIEILDLDHHITEASAYHALRAFEQFMADDRELDPELSFVSDVEVFEFASVQLSVLKRNPVVWEVREQAHVTDFLQNPMIARRDWCPIPVEDIVAGIVQLAAERGVPTWLLDQYDAEARVQIGLEPPAFPEDSPFHDVFLD